MSVIYQWGTFPSQENLFQANNQIKVFELDYQISSVACGQSHFVLLSSNGIFGWGNNEHGQLGFHGPSHFDQITDLNLPLNAKIK